MSNYINCGILIYLALCIYFGNIIKDRNEELTLYIDYHFILNRWVIMCLRQCFKQKTNGKNKNRTNYRKTLGVIYTFKKTTFTNTFSENLKILAYNSMARKKKFKTHFVNFHSVFNYWLFFRFEATANNGINTLFCLTQFFFFNIPSKTWNLLTKKWETDWLCIQIYSGRLWIERAYVHNKT